MTPQQSPATPNGHATAHPIPVATAVPAGLGEEKEITINLIDPDPDQPRKEFDEERNKELQGSLGGHGLFYAIIVYLVLASGRYRIIDGERRWRAAKALGWATIRARVLKEPPDEITRRELHLIGNEQRTDLTEIERGKAYLEYMTLAHCTASALAQKVGKHVSTVTRAVAIIRKLPEDVRTLVGEKLPPAAARLLTGLKDDEKKRLYARLFVEGQVKTADELAAVIKGAHTGQPGRGMTEFACEESGVKITVSWSRDPADPQALGNVENALRTLLKDLAGQKSRGLAHWKTFLEKKANAARKAAEAASAQNALASVANGLPPPASTHPK